MRCLAVRQPWASLVVHGMTRFLARSWCTSYRGPLGIHAAVQMPPSQIELCCDPEMRSFLHRSGYDFAMELPRGALVGVVEIVDCEYITSRAGLDAQDPAVMFGVVRPGRWAWRCERAEVFAQLVPMRGQLGLFEVPDDLVFDRACRGGSLSVPCPASVGSAPINDGRRPSATAGDSRFAPPNVTGCLNVTNAPSPNGHIGVF